MVKLRSQAKQLSSPLTRGSWAMARTKKSKEEEASEEEHINEEILDEAEDGTEDEDDFEEEDAGTSLKIYRTVIWHCS